jgi:DNA-binding MarR family transcriptional regulator
MIIEATPASRALATKVERAWAELERRTAGPLTDRQRRDVLRSLGLLEDTLLATEA